MRIQGWECSVSEDGMSRGATHPTNGTFTWLHGRLIGAGDAPREVVEWLIRPRLRKCWESGCVMGLGAPLSAATTVHQSNPYNDEPPNKDKAPS